MQKEDDVTIDIIYIQPTKTEPPGKQC